jgi:hypothetical protein
VSGSSKLLILGGVALAALGMLYGLHYALFVEHQTLDRMGGSLNDAFVAVASENPPQAHAALQAYGNTKYNYVRQVDAHSHWGGLAMLLIVFGVLVDRAGFAERTRLWLAIALLLGSVLFPLAVLLQTAKHGGIFASALAVVGSGLVILSLSGIAVGFARR